MLERSVRNSMAALLFTASMTVMEVNLSDPLRAKNSIRACCKWPILYLRSKLCCPSVELFCALFVSGVSQCCGCTQHQFVLRRRQFHRAHVLCCSFRVPFQLCEELTCNTNVIIIAIALVLKLVEMGGERHLPSWPGTLPSGTSRSLLRLLV